MNNTLQNIEAEQAVLGSILYESSLADECILTADEFSREAHRLIFGAVERLRDKERSIDVVTIVSELGDTVQQCGGTSYLAELANSIPTTANFDDYQALVHHCYLLRRAHKKMTSFVDNPDEDKLAEISQEIDAMIDETAATSEEPSDREVLIELMDSLGQEQGELSGITTGSTELDKMTSGLQDGELIIVAARPSVGKSALAINIGIAAGEQDVVVDLFSMEMPKRMVLQRILSALGSVSGGKWKNPKRFMNDLDVQKITNAIGHYEDIKISVHENSSPTVMSVRSEVRKSLKKYPNHKHLVILDYLSFIDVPGKFERNDLKIGAITKGLKRMARKFNLPVLLVCQLSRGVEQRQDKRPMMSDLQDSERIEQDADMILFLYRDDYYNKESEKQNIVEIIVAKPRNGPVGTVDMAFIKEYGKFCNLDRKHAATV
ncbi:replicative DNA helicase [Sporolactobacillus kofuensis]|uniref:DNA 5'-3' helicase n=1 Tax=Sporolactobacillus kofuensis TaxID=269672 RepID=A0ABW1WDS3_9BACL|nr:replicative DNA helicase [Sporolactobacillus kofuensis]MCO7176141.1 replicative DNA helicase [Sporolactobacillus kofuensis]